MKSFLYWVFTAAVAAAALLAFTSPEYFGRAAVYVHLSPDALDMRVVQVSLAGLALLLAAAGTAFHSMKMEGIRTRMAALKDKLAQLKPRK